MTDIEIVRNRLLELTRTVNKAKGEEKEKLAEEKEKVYQQYIKMKRERENTFLKQLYSGTDEFKNVERWLDNVK